MSSEADRPRLNRVLLKLSGEALAGEEKSGLNAPMVRFIA